MTNSRSPKRQRTSSASSLPESIHGFSLLPINLPSPLPSVPSAVHILYIRRHEESLQPPAVASPESSRMMFVVNVPVDSTKETLRGLFASLGGRLEDVRFHGQEDDDTEDSEKLLFPEVWDRRLIPAVQLHISPSQIRKMSVKYLKLSRKNDEIKQAQFENGEWELIIQHPPSAYNVSSLLHEI